MDFPEAIRTAPAILYPKCLIVPKRRSLRCAAGSVLDGSMTAMHSRDIEGLSPCCPALMLDEQEAGARSPWPPHFQPAFRGVRTIRFAFELRAHNLLTDLPSDSSIADQEIARARRRLQVNSAAQATLACEARKERFACTHG